VSDWILNPEWEHAQFVSISELRECERKLKASDENVRQLKIIISRASTAFFCDGSDGQVASRMWTILEEARKPMFCGEQEAKL
jgi:hypothetical protein